MNKKWLIIFFIIIFSNIILADDINIFIERTEYKQYETIIFKIFSNVDLSDEIELSQLGVYDIYNDKRSSSIVLTEINKKEYMGYIDTAYLNKGEYYFAINSVEYFKDSKLKRSNFQINFNINDNKEDVISIYPGIFYKKIDLWENPWIDFKFENKGNNTITFTPKVNDTFLLYSDGQLNLNINQEKSVRLRTKVDSINRKYIQGEFIILNYHIPILFERINFIENITPNITQSENISQPYFIDNITNLTIEDNITNLTIEDNITKNLTKRLEFENEFEEINKNITVNNDINGWISIKNSGDVLLTNITLELTDGLEKITNIDTPFIPYLEPKEIQSIFIQINSNHNIDKNYDGYLLATTPDGLEAKLPIIIMYIIEDTTIESKLNEDEPIIDQYFGCTTNEDCAEDLICEQNNCVSIKKTNWILIIIIGCILILFGFIIFFYFKSKKTYTELKK